MSENLEQKYSCPSELTPPTDEDLGGWMANLAMAMGITTCQSSVEDTNIDGRIIGWSKILGPYMGKFSAEITNTINIGCEQLLFLARQYNILQRNITCIINQSKQTVKDTTSAIQSVNIISTGGSVKILCDDGFIINQGIRINVIKSFNLTSDEISDIANEMKNFLLETVDTLQKSKSEFLSAPDAQKTIDATITKIEQTDYTKKVSEALQDFEVLIDGNQNVLIQAFKDVEIVTKKQCQINQNFILDLMSDVIIQNTIKEDVRSLFENVNEYNKKIQQEADRKGKPPTKLERIIKLIIIGVAVIGVIMLLLLIVRLIMKKNNKKSK
jgi:hypothetical protein